MIKSSYSRIHPSRQFLIFISLTVGIMIVGYLIGAAAIIALYGTNTLVEAARPNLSAPNAVRALWVLQIISTSVPILAAAVIFANVIVKDPRHYIKLTFKFPWVLLVIVFVVIMMSLPLIEFLSNINQKMVLPHFLNGVQRWMRESEDQAQKVTTILLQMKTIWSMIFRILVIGLLTGIAEEFMFRGCIQTIFTRRTKNTHAAIWITAILFSAFHFEFFGFLSRMMLGVLFGYLVVWSGSIWTSVFAHATFNSTQVVLAYFYQHHKTSVNPDDQHIFNYFGYLFSFIIILFLLYLYRNIAKPVSDNVLTGVKDIVA